MKTTISILTMLEVLLPTNPSGNNQNQEPQEFETIAEKAMETFRQLSLQSQIPA